MRRPLAQHAQKPRMSWSVRAAIWCLIVLIPILVCELLLFFGVI